MDKPLKKYKILIEYNDSSIDSETIEIKTTNVDWTMDQYQRNREPFTFKVIDEADI